MADLADFWLGFLGERHAELLREASQERMARGSRRMRKEARGVMDRTPRATEPADARTVVRLGTALDAPRIADLLQLNGMPRWVAFEERFIIVEENGTLAAAMRFRAGTDRLHLGLLVTDPWAEEHLLAVALYSRARATARDLGLREVRAQTPRHEWQLYQAGYRRRGGIWSTPAV